MDAVTKTPMTVEAFDASPFCEVLSRQYIRSKLVAVARPLPHEPLAVKSALNTALAKFLYRHREFGGVYAGPLNVAIQGPEGPERYQPDTLVYRRERLALLQGCASWWAPFPVPDLAGEVLAPQTRHYDLGVKPWGYAQSGLPELWIADPERRKVQVYLLQQDAAPPARVVKKRGTLRTDLLPGFELPVRRLFPPFSR